MECALPSPKSQSYVSGVLLSGSNAFAKSCTSAPARTDCRSKTTLLTIGGRFRAWTWTRRDDEAVSPSLSVTVTVTLWSPPVAKPFVSVVVCCVESVVPLLSKSHA